MKRPERESLKLSPGPSGRRIADAVRHRDRRRQLSLPTAPEPGPRPPYLRLPPRLGVTVRGSIAYGDTSRATAPVTGNPTQSNARATSFCIPGGPAEQECHRVQRIPQSRLRERPREGMSFWGARGESNLQ